MIQSPLVENNIYENYPYLYEWMSKYKPILTFPVSCCKFLLLILFEKGIKKASQNGSF